MPGLFDLNAELRIYIYSYVLIHDHHILLSGWPLSLSCGNPCSCDETSSQGPVFNVHGTTAEPMHPLDVALTQVSRQSRAETLDIYYGRNGFVIELIRNNRRITCLDLIWMFSQPYAA